MKFKSRFAAAAIAVAFPLGAGAMPVLWQFSGHLDAVTGNVGIPIAAGDAFSIVVGFDTGAALLGQAAGRYRYDPASITFSIRVDGLGPFNSGYNPAAGGTFFVRNNAVPPEASPPLVDGLTFGLNDFNDAGGLDIFSLVMRNGDTSIFADGSVPTTPDPRLVTGYARSFQFCSSSANDPNSCNLAEVDGTLEAVRALPEPAGIALLAAGFAGVALTRRRKA
jgi:hypothetical protein